MKKLIIFLSFAMMLLVVGCQKEDIRPNTDDDSISHSGDNKGMMTDDSTDNGNNDNSEEPVKPITDPNHDEDEDDKIKR